MLLALAAGGPALAQVDGLAGPAPGTLFGAPSLSVGQDVLAGPGAIPAQPSGPQDRPVRLLPFFDSPVSGPPAPLQRTLPGDRSVQVIPFLSGRALATDNSEVGSGTQKRAEFTGTLTPAVGVLAQTSRLDARGVYAPSFIGFANEQRFSRIDQRFIGDATLTLVPGSVFLDARATAFVQPVAGALPGQDITALPRRNVSQTYFLSLAPYAVQRFGTTATMLAGYLLQYAERLGTTASLTPGGLPFFAPQTLLANSAFLAVRTGEDFGPFAAEFRLRGAYYQGTGSLDGAHRAAAIVETRYALTRNFFALAEGGYESIRFTSVPPIDIQEPIWGVGFRWDPGPNSTIIARYRRREGINAPQLEARLGLGARTVATARYDEGLGNALQRSADLLQTVQVDDRGVPVDRLTGAPQADLAGVSVLALQNGVFRTRRGSAAITHFLPRDTLTLAFNHIDRQVVANDPGVVAFSQTANTLEFTWTHLLTERTSLVGFASAGRFETPETRGSRETWLGRVSLRHAFSETLQGAIEYQVARRRTTLADPNVPISAFSNGVQNAVIVNFRKRF